MKQKKNLQLNPSLIKIIAVITIFISSFYYAYLPHYAGVLKGLSWIILMISSLLDTIRNFAQQKKNDDGLFFLLGFVMFLTNRIEEAVVLLLIHQIIKYYHQIQKKRESLNNRTVSIKRKNKIEQIPFSKIKKNMILILNKGQILPVDGIIYNPCLGKNFSTKSVDKILAGSYIEENYLEVKTLENYQDSNFIKLEKQREEVFQKQEKRERNIERQKRKILIAIGVFFIIVPNFITQQFEYFSIYLGTVILIFAMQTGFQSTFQRLKEKMIRRLFSKNISTADYQNIKKVNHIQNMIFEKTKTLTLGELRVTGIKAKDEKQLLEYLNYVEYYSTHPIAETIKNYKKMKIDTNKIKKFLEIPGRGVECFVGKQHIIAGNIYFLKEKGINPKKEQVVGTVIYVAIDHTYFGNIVLSDSIKYSMKNLTEDLKKYGVKNTCILSGDNEMINKAICQALKINDQYSNLTQSEKEFWFKHLTEQTKGKTMFIGNETTNEKLLEIADVSGILLEGQESAKKSDIFIMNNQLETLPDLFQIIKDFQKEKHQLIFFYIGLRVVWILLAWMESLPLWLLLSIEEIIVQIIKFRINRKW